MIFPIKTWSELSCMANPAIDNSHGRSSFGIFTDHESVSPERFTSEDIYWCGCGGLDRFLATLWEYKAGSPQGPFSHPLYVDIVVLKDCLLAVLWKYEPGSPRDASPIHFVQTWWSGRDVP